MRRAFSTFIFFALMATGCDTPKTYEDLSEIGTAQFVPVGRDLDCAGVTITAPDDYICRIHPDGDDFRGWLFPKKFLSKNPQLLRAGYAKLRFSVSSSGFEFLDADATDYAEQKRIALINGAVAGWATGQERATGKWFGEYHLFFRRDRHNYVSFLFTDATREEMVEYVKIVRSARMSAVSSEEHAEKTYSTYTEEARAEERLRLIEQETINRPGYEIHRPREFENGPESGAGE